MFSVFNTGNKIFNANASYLQHWCFSSFEWIAFTYSVQIYCTFFLKIITFNPMKLQNKEAGSTLIPGKGALKICIKFTREHPCRSVISIKLLYNFSKIILWYECSPINLLHIFRTPFPENPTAGLLLKQDCYVVIQWNSKTRRLLGRHYVTLKN